MGLGKMFPFIVNDNIVSIYVDILLFARYDRNEERRNTRRFLVDFSKRLNRLMTVMGTNNNRLARALSLDASLVSRWRTGSRTPKRIQNHAGNIAGYYMRIAQSDSQRRALMEIMELQGEIPQESEMAQRLAQWLIGGGDDDESRRPASRAVSSDAATEATVRISSFGETRALMDHFLDEIERPDSGDVRLFLGAEGDSLLDDDYEKTYQTFRFVLMSGRSIRLVLRSRLRRIWEETAFRWVDLAFYGDFQILTADTDPVLNQTWICLCGRFGMECGGEGEEKRILSYDSPELIRLRSDLYSRILSSAQACFRRDRNGAAERSGTIRIHTSLREEAGDGDGPSAQILVLPHLSFWQDYLQGDDADTAAERFRILSEMIRGWENRIRRDVGRRYSLVAANRIHNMHWHSLDIRKNREGYTVSGTENGQTDIVILNREWVRIMDRFFADADRFPSDPESACDQLEAYRNRLLFQYGTYWNTDPDEEARIRKTVHPLYGECTEYLRTENGQPQYFTEREGDICILKLSEKEKEAREFTGYVSELSQMRDKENCLLVSISDRNSWDLALKLGYRPTGRLLGADGNPIAGSAADAGLMRAEMRREKGDTVN